MDLQHHRSPFRLINRAARLSHRICEQRLKPLGLSVGQLPVFGLLNEGQAMSQTQLARLTHIEQPSMAQTLSRMARDGLIDRAPDPDDARSSLVSLTERAAALMPEAHSIMQTYHDEVLHCLNAAEHAELLYLLSRVVTALEAVDAAL